MAGYMAHFLASDLHRVQMIVSYLAVPRLALAAAMHFWNESVLVNSLMPALHSALVSDTVGAWGEVGKIIFIISCDTECVLAWEKPGDVVPLLSVLQ